MIRTNDIDTKIILGDNRKFNAELSINYLSLAHDSSIQILAPNAVTGSIPDQIVEKETLYIHDRLFTGTAAKNKIFPYAQNIYADAGFKQRRKIGKSRIGYIGKKADADGGVNDTIAIRFSPRNVSNLIIITDTGRLIIDAVFTASDIAGRTLFEREIRDNDQNRIELEINADRVSYMYLQITKSTPNKRIWILAMTPVMVSNYSKTMVVDMKYESKKTTNKEGSIGRLYIQDLNATLFNEGRAFDFQNIKSPMYGLLRKGVELNAKLSLEGASFFNPLGTFYIDSWEAAEDKATVALKSICLIGILKDTVMNDAILDSTNIYECFVRVADFMGLSRNTLPEELKNIKLGKYAIQGKIADVLNDLCLISNSICYMNNSGDGLTVRVMPTIRGSARYPARFFTTHEYSKTDKKKSDTPNPNVIDIEYSLAEYERNLIIADKETVPYADIPTREFPEIQKGLTAPGEREIGAGTSPSKTFIFTRPERYAGIEVSDPFLPEIFEFDIYDSDPELPITVKLWSFESEDPDAQVTVAAMKKSSHEEILIDSSIHTILPRPSGYVQQDLTAQTTETRNVLNTPQVFSVKLSGKYSISNILAGNVFKPGQFEYVIEKTGTGCTVRVWNYMRYAQDFSVKIYGRRIIENDDTRVITVRNEDAILRDGEIYKSIRFNGLESDEIARNLSRAVSSFFNTFKTSFSFEPWTDIRLLIGDFIAMESSRGYGYSEGIIEEITLNYKGYIEQKLKLLESNKHNRDCRVFAGYVIGDRPVMSYKQEGYA